MKIKSVTQLNESSYEDFLTHYNEEIEKSINLLIKLKKYQEDGLGLDYNAVEDKLSVYDENVQNKIDEWINNTPSPDEITQFALRNQDRWGTEPQMILYAIEDFATVYGIYFQDDEDDEDDFYEGSFQFDKGEEDAQNESIETIDNFTAQYYDNYDDEEEETDYEVDFQNNSEENLKKIQMFEDFIDKVTYEMSGHPPKNLWEYKADFENDMQKWGYLHTRLNKKTDMLITESDDLNTLKCQKAKKDGIPIYTYDEAFKKKEKLYTRVIRGKKLANLKPEKD